MHKLDNQQLPKWLVWTHLVVGAVAAAVTYLITNWPF